MASIPPNVDLCTVPAAKPPNHYTKPNFLDPLSLSTTNIAVSSILTAFAYLFVGARLWNNKQRIKWSDYLTVAGLCLYSANIGVILWMTRYNRHQWDIPVCWFNDSYLKKLYAQVLTFGMTQLVSKAAILVLYLEIFSVKPGMRIAIYVGLGFTISMYLTFIPFASYFNAPHAGKPWQSLLTQGSPKYLLPWAVSVGSGSVLLDLYIFVLPLPVISRLSLSASRRLQLIGVFGTALIGVAASLVSLIYRIKLFLDADDSTWNEASVQISNTAENAVTLIVGSGPAFASFFKMQIVGSSVWGSIPPMFWSFSKRSGSKTGSHVSRGSRKFASPKGSSVADMQPGLELTDTKRFNSTASAKYDRLEDSPVVRKGLINKQGNVLKTITISQLREEVEGSTDKLVW